MTTIEAFTVLINDLEKCMAIGMTPINYRKLKSGMKKNKKFETDSNDAMVKWLTAAGWKHTTTWEKE